ncbi:hypothetical protein IFM89_028507 [Coptis chinensis]|uniref:tRNA-guanine(15) transglycosylase-like domain-containing protein n=1 Tax=Coptis chinensis TaxID=261450 RepID=A0A835HQR0_9MAGN|nr:hypothetical protein IFM89_028507 [Coptis chinensis]
MKFTVKALSNSSNGNGRARVGLLQLGNCPTPIETPSLLLSTRKALPVFIAPHLLPSLPSPDSHLLQVSPLHFLESPTPNAISSIGGLHKMVGLHKHCFVAAPRDSMLCLPVCESSNKFGASFETPCGRRLIRPAEYMEMISSLKPNLWASLADEVPAWVNAGYWIGGFGLGESAEKRSALLTAVTDVLPKEKPRQICGLGLPEEVLLGVASGVDLFDSMYIYHLTLGGFALVFPLNRDERHISNSQLSDTGGDCTKINLRATVYRKDKSPIADNCRCYTCQNHTRAYINHLLNVHEMLAQILLEIHNTHHYLGFFRTIREAIKNGEFDHFCQKFIEGRREHLAAAACS